MKSNSSIARFRFAIMLWILAFLTANCFAVHHGDGDGNVIKQDRQVSGFNKINISSAFHVMLTQGDKEALTVEADDNLMDNIITEVVGNELKIHCKRGGGHSKKMTIYLTFKNLKDLEVSVAVELETTNHLKLQDLKLDISGAAEMKMDLEADRLDGDLSGASEMDLTGRVSSASIEISGASEIDALEMEIADLILDVSGASEAKVNVTGTLKVEASGASDVRYKGSPKIDANSSGASSIKSY
jgi:hypothetical protein